jgi:hypothetical protein
MRGELFAGIDHLYHDPRSLLSYRRDRRNCQNRVIAKIEKQNLTMMNGKDKLKSREIADIARDREKQNR